jgi:hypothetical protein
MFQAKVVEKIKTHVLCSVTDDNIKRPKRFACWIPKATNTRSECVILIAFPQQQWLHERACLLGQTYIGYLVINVTPR